MPKTKAKDLDRCTGACCEKFWLGFSPEELKQSFFAARAGADGALRMNQETPQRARILMDIEIIYPMVTYLGFFPPSAIAKEQPGINLDPSDTPGHYYTCKHYDWKTHDCTIYDVRPDMCRSYPGPARCNFARCTWTEQRQASHPKLPVLRDRDVQRSSSQKQTASSKVSLG